MVPSTRRPKVRIEYESELKLALSGELDLRIRICNRRRLFAGRRGASLEVALAVGTRKVTKKSFVSSLGTPLTLNNYRLNDEVDNKYYMLSPFRNLKLSVIRIDVM